MLNFFRTNQLSGAFFFILYVAILRCSGFFFPSLRLELPESRGYFSTLLFDSLSNSFLGQEVLMISLLCFQAFILTLIVVEHRMAREVSLFTGVFYLLISASSAYFLPLSGQVLGNTFLIFAVWAMLRTYRVPACADTIFNIGFWIAIATLFEVSYVVFLLWGIFGLNFMRALKFKEILTLLVGFITPYVLVSVWYFWNDTYDAFWQQHLYEGFRLTRFSLPESLWESAGLGFMILLLIISLLSSGEYMKKKGIQVQKRISVLLLFTFISLGTGFFQGTPDPTGLLILLIPLSVFMGFIFTNLSRPSASAIHLVWFVLAIVLQFRPIIFGG